ncbi:MAG: hypothetical protein J3K34DRAFT_516044 [Monoraphidium minutum]|nr:MAG: hypothetical protein J3K34DRAFT_516044 [Monoraphidium minutum]
MEEQVLAEFASPFKRRKAALMDKGPAAAGADGFCSPPPAARKALGRFFTPQGKAKPAAPADMGPTTPGADARGARTDCRGADAARGGAAPSPGRESGGSALPPQLAVLRDLLGALYATLPLVKSRGQPATFLNLRGPVQNLSGRGLKVEHLRQIKAIYPRAFAWQHALVAAGRGGRLEEQLVLALLPYEPPQRDDEDGGGGGAAGTPSRRTRRGAAAKGGATPAAAAAAPPPAVGCSASVAGTMQQQREFVELLRARAAGGEVEDADSLPLAPLPPPAPASARDGTPVRRQGSGSSAASEPGAQPATPQTGASGRAALSPFPGTPGTDATVRSLAFSPLPGAKAPVPRFDGAAPGASTPGGTKRTAAGAPLQRTPGRGAATAPPAAGGGLLSPRGGHGMRPSRLCFDSVAAEQADGKAAAAAAGKEQEEQDAAKGPRPRRLAFGAPAPAAPAAAAERVPLAREGSGGGRALSGGLQFELKASTMALLDRAASAQVRVEQARQAAELSARHHLDLAASTFEVLRRVFGEKGPCALPREQVVSQIRSRSTSKSGVSAADADEQLRLMLRLLPAWIRLDHPEGVALADMRVVVRIHRRTPWGELRGQLLGRLAAARAEGAAAAGAGADAEAAAAAEAEDLARAALGAAAARCAAAAAAQAGGGPEAEEGGGGGVDASEVAARLGGRGGGGEGEAERAAAAEAPRQDAPAAGGGAAGGAGAEARDGGGADVREELLGGGGRSRSATPEQEDLAAALKARVWGRRG